MSNLRSYVDTIVREAKEMSKCLFQMRSMLSLDVIFILKAGKNVDVQYPSSNTNGFANRSKFSRSRPFSNFNSDYGILSDIWLWLI